MFRFETSQLCSSLWIAARFGHGHVRQPEQMGHRGVPPGAFGKGFLLLMKEQKNKHSPFSAACEGASAAANPEEGRVERTWVQEGPGSLTLSCAMNYESADPGATPTPHLLLYETVELLPVGSLLLAAKSMGTDLKENKHTHGTNSVSAALPAWCTDYNAVCHVLWGLSHSRHPCHLHSSSLTCNPHYQRRFSRRL